ncbi:MAG TPA: hypothetical protein VFH92_01915 [Phenylobacterium sp.]|nr:hypothetical protein [Phenylobacterium sp.]
MAEDLDRLLGRLSAADVALPGGLDESVLAAIASRREDGRKARALAPVGIASVGLAMAIGVTAGGLAAVAATAEPRQLSTFSADAHLAPSSLLDGRG